MVALIVICFVYFMPTINAILRKHHNIKSITVVNVFLGWTFVGWVVALSWSYSK